MSARVAAVLVLVPFCTACTLSTPTTPATTAAAPATFASFLAIGGTSVHTFSVTQAGTIAITLTIVTPAGVVGLGVGGPTSGGPGCSLTNSLDASAAIADPTTGTTSPQLTIPAEVGTYCVEVYDSGQLGGVGRTFSLSIAHP